MNKIINELERILPHINFKSEDKLVDSGILDSLDIILIISELEALFNIHIPSEYINPEYFNSVAMMDEMVNTILNNQKMNPVDLDNNI